MKKILLIGSDLHAVRYINSLIFVNEIKLYLLNDCHEAEEIIRKYNIGELKNEGNFENRINQFEYIIFTIPNGFNYKYCNLLKQYKRNLLLEKPQLKVSLFEKMICNIYFIHLRKFDNKIYETPKNINYIKWPNLINDQMNAIINTLPNIIDFIESLYKKKSNDIEIYEIKKSLHNITLRINLNNQFVIKIYNTDNKSDCPTMNGKNIGWPNYFLCINNLAKEILQDNLNYKESIINEQKCINFIEKIGGVI